MGNLVDATQLTGNPFKSGNTPAIQNAMMEAESQRAIQEVQAAMVIAKRFPRDPVVAMDRILQACTRPSLANSGLYSYSKGGNDVSGPSIRLAEAMAQAWGNIQFGVRELSQSNGESTVEAFAWDVETNTRQVKVFQVSHIRHTKNSQKLLTDPREIYEVVANQGARRLRACILGIIPGDVTEAATQQCETTMKSTADTSEEAIKKMIEAFSEFGVSASAIQKRLQCRPEAIRPAQMVQMKKIYASLRDGMSEANQWFEVDSVSDLKTRSQRVPPLDSAPDSEREEAAASQDSPPEAPPADDMFAQAEPVQDKPARQRRQREVE